MPRRPIFDVSDTMLVCPMCGGSGVIPDPDVPGATMTCPTCDGTGRVRGAVLGDDGAFD